MQTSVVNGLGILATTAGSFVIGWILANKQARRERDADLQDVRFQVNHLMAILTLTVKGGLQWEALPGNGRRLRVTKDALLDVSDGGPSLDTVLLACQDHLGSEFVMDLYPDEQARIATRR